MEWPTASNGSPENFSANTSFALISLIVCLVIVNKFTM